jgi:hypothetical protein
LHVTAPLRSSVAMLAVPAAMSETRAGMPEEATQIKASCLVICVDMEDAEAIGARILSTRYTSSTDFEHACVFNFRFGISENAAEA